MTRSRTSARRFHVPVRCAGLIDAPEAAVRRALVRSDVWIRSATAVGGLWEVAGAAPTLVQGGMVRFRRGPHSRTVLLQAAWSAGLPVLDSAVSSGRSAFRVGMTSAPTAAGVLVTLEFIVERALPVLNPLPRRSLIRFGEMLLGVTTLVAREPVRVVAGAVVADGAVLMARRKSSTADGRWELPGGKVEAGESDEQALERELLEELAIRCKVSRRIGPVVEIEAGMDLFCYQAEMSTGGQIRLVDHDEYRWVGPDELASLDMVAADRGFVDSLRRVLQIDS